MNGPAARPATRPDDLRLAESRLARGHHAGMVAHYARAVRRARGAVVPDAWLIGELLDELRHHRRRHRAFNRHVWGIGDDQRREPG